MEKKLNNHLSSTQLTLLVILRVLIGWHFFYEGYAKLTNPNWSSASYLLDSQGFLSGFYESLANSPDVLQIVDFLNIWGLIFIGAALIFGLFTRISLGAGILLLALYYLSHPPFVGAVYAVPAEGSYLMVNKTLIELFAMAVLLVFPSQKIGFDRFIMRLFNKS